MKPTVEVLTFREVDERRAALLASLAGHRAAWTVEQWQKAADAYLLDERELAWWSDYRDLCWLAGDES